MAKGRSARKKGGEMAFEDALARLEGIVKRLEEGEVPLEESLALFEEGVHLARLCSTRLDEAQQRIDALQKNRDGKPALRPFAPSGDAGEDDPAAEGDSGRDDEDEEGGETVPGPAKPLPPF